jgi:hypothetical protein
MARPVPLKDESKRTTVAVLAVGGAVVLGLLGVGAMVALRQPPPASPALAATSAVTPSPAEPKRLEPSQLLAEAKKQALVWHPDAVLVSVDISRVDARGVRPDGSIEVVYARPATSRFTGGADTRAERLVLRAQGQSGALEKSEQRAGKARVVPEPNCAFEDAWSAAQRAGAASDGSLKLRYVWSEKHARPVWEVQGSDGDVQRRLDGVGCSILTR